MSDILDRLHQRRFPWANKTLNYFTLNANTRPVGRTTEELVFTIDPSKPDEDIDDAIKEIERLREALQFYAEHAGEYANVAIDALKD